MDFWYLLISRRATVPGLYLCGFLTPPVEGADFLAALVASCFLGAFPPVDFLAVCLVRAMTLCVAGLESRSQLTLAVCAEQRRTPGPARGERVRRLARAGGGKTLMFDNSWDIGRQGDTSTCGVVFHSVKQRWTCLNSIFSTYVKILSSLEISDALKIAVSVERGQCSASNIFNKHCK